MHIDTSLGQHNHHSRVISVEKAQVSAEQPDDNTRNRVPLNPSLSRAILSKTLANVLWEVGGPRVDSARNNQPLPDNVDRREAELSWVRNAYAEYE